MLRSRTPDDAVRFISLAWMILYGILPLVQLIRIRKSVLSCRLQLWGCDETGEGRHMMSCESARKMGIRRLSLMKRAISSNECVVSWPAPTNAREMDIQSSSLRFYPLLIHRLFVEEARLTPSCESPPSPKSTMPHLFCFWRRVDILPVSSVSEYSVA